MKRTIRRRLLQAAFASSSAALWPYSKLFAQSGSTLLRAPKQALIIGNSKYKQSPLKNPANDAQGIADALKSTGFAVTLGLELTQADMSEAIRSYLATLVKSRAVGLFYFAGHGVQLAWRNYLVPIDAQIDNIEQVRQRAIDVNTLVEGIRKAGNPMNMIVLDACRDNPFGAQAGVEQRGLSQLDAPPGTLLAYATAPGNTAADGEGSNGLYTENLLREIKVPEAKVEDVFKRVRLSVRKSSKGQQVPWESTSLEEDFWFIPPKVLKKLADEEAEREFKQELALWERVQNAAEPGPLEDYLRRYPSGRFAELAQLRLDQVLARQGETKVEIVSAPRNPYSKGTERTDTAYKIGDTWTYRRIDLLTRLEESEPRWRVTDITETEVIYNDGRRITDLLGNVRRPGGGSIWGPNQTIPVEFAVGKRWNSRFDFITERGKGSVLDLDLRIVDREMIIVPAGTFNAFRIEARGWLTGEAHTEWNWKRWYAPEQVRQHLAWELFTRNMRGRINNSYRSELVSFQQL